MDKPSALEKTTGNIGTSIAATLLAVCSGTPIAALLPILTTTLASERHKKRVSDAIDEISSDLENMEEKIKNITDQQYKIINETILTLFQTTEENKIAYLKNVIKNSINNNQFSSHEASLISRIVRDISASEFIFLLEKHTYERILYGTNEPFDQRSCKVDPQSEDGLIVNGLINLGLLTPGEPTDTSSTLLKFAPITEKLFNLLQE